MTTVQVGDSPLCGVESLSDYDLFNNRQRIFTFNDAQALSQEQAKASQKDKVTFGSIGSQPKIE